MDKQKPKFSTGKIRTVDEKEIKINLSLLHYICAKRGVTNENIAKKLGISRQSYQSRLNGIVPFDNVEIQTIRDYLKLSDTDVESIFFTTSVK